MTLHTTASKAIHLPAQLTRAQLNHCTRYANASSIPHRVQSREHSRIPPASTLFTDTDTTDTSDAETGLTDLLDTKEGSLSTCVTFPSNVTFSDTLVASRSHVNSFVRRERTRVHLSMLDATTSSASSTSTTDVCRGVACSVKGARDYTLVRDDDTCSPPVGNHHPFTSACALVWVHASQSIGVRTLKALPRGTALCTVAGELRHASEYTHEKHNIDTRLWRVGNAQIIDTRRVGNIASVMNENAPGLDMLNVYLHGIKCAGANVTVVPVRRMCEYDAHTITHSAPTTSHTSIIELILVTTRDIYAGEDLLLDESIRSRLHTNTLNDDAHAHALLESTTTSTAPTAEESTTNDTTTNASRATIAKRLRRQLRAIRMRRRRLLKHSIWEQ